MRKPKTIDPNLESLIALLASEDGMIRQSARKTLEVLGAPAVSSLVQLLKKSKLHQVRWEAAKALGEISDARSIRPLVQALEDNNHDVAWLAAEALIKFKMVAWQPMLRALVKNGADSGSLRKGVHHVLLKQKDNEFDDLLPVLMKTLEFGAVSQSTPVAAYEILKRMRTNL